MGRPKNADPAATKQKILDAAIDELDEVGAIALSTRSVARRAGVGVATVHGHFGDRQGLLDALIERIYERLTESVLSIREELHGDATPRQMVIRTVRSGFRFCRGHQSEMRALTLQVATAGAMDLGRQRGTQLPFLAMAASYLAPELGIDVDAVRLRVQTLVFAVNRWGISSDEELQKLVGHDDVDECVRLAEDYLVELALSQLTKRGR